MLHARSDTRAAARPLAPVHSACAAAGKPDVSKETRWIVNRNRECRRRERDGVGQDVSHPEVCRDTVTPPAPTPGVPGNESHHPSRYLCG